MYYSNQVEKPLPIIKEKVSSLVDFGLKKYYGSYQAENKRISIRMNDSDPIATVMKRSKEKKTLWVDDPLRLCLEPVFPFAQLDQLPYGFIATATPTPPTKEISSSTPALPPPILLPLETLKKIDSWQQIENAWLYSRDPPTPIFQDQETWEAIFHPLSTFKHNQGELEYYAWNSTHLPVTAARVIHATEATIPQLMPTPPLKPSPVLTLEHTIVHSPHPHQGYYYDMLQKIHGDPEKSPSFKAPKPHFLSTLLHKKPTTNVVDPESLQQKRYWTEKRLFFAGFVCPFLWLYASLGKSTQETWQKRCRLAFLYSTLIVSIMTLVVSIKAAGSVGSRQATSDTIRAVVDQ